jgi:hypothetical protein
MRRLAISFIRTWDRYPMLAWFTFSLLATLMFGPLGAALVFLLAYLQEDPARQAAEVNKPITQFNLIIFVYIFFILVGALLFFVLFSVFESLPARLAALAHLRLMPSEIASQARAGHPAGESAYAGLVYGAVAFALLMAVIGRYRGLLRAEMHSVLDWHRALSHGRAFIITVFVWLCIAFALWTETVHGSRPSRTLGTLSLAPVFVGYLWIYGLLAVRNIGERLRGQ